MNRAPKHGDSKTPHLPGAGFASVYPENQEKPKLGGAEIQTSAVDARTAVWVHH